MYIILPHCLLVTLTLGNVTKPNDYQYLPYTNWMSYFRNFTVGDLPVIPGSHDSGTLQVNSDEGWVGIAGWLYAQTQDTTISGQLNLGVRILDLRLYVTQDVFDTPDSIYISHTYRTNLTLTDALNEVGSFLTTNPTEFLYVIVRIDTGHPLQEEIEAKQAYIESVLNEASVTWANIDSLQGVKVSDVAGKAILITIADTILAPNSTMKYIDYYVNYDVCSIFQYTTQYVAQQVIGACFLLSNPSTNVTGTLYGYALDGQFDQLWPNITSREMNDWFFYNFQQNQAWVKRRESSPMGVMLIDFVNIEYMSILIDYNMQIANSSYVKITNTRYYVNAMMLIIALSINMLL